jgi:uncharacterized protein with FMN-binding domain
MRRIVIALMATFSGLVLAFSYHTSTNSPGTTLAGSPLGSGAGSGGAALPSDSPLPLPSSDGQDAGDGGNADWTDDAPASPTPEPSTAPSSEPSTAPAKPAAPSGTFAGRVAQTQWGPVQVQIVVKNGKIVSSDVLQVPMENHHDVVINTEAVPMLNQMTVDAQSPNFDNISGATVTTDGYKASLASAIDKAHL